MTNSDRHDIGQTLIEAREPADIAAVKVLFEEYAASLDFDLGFQDFEAEMAGFPGKYAPPKGVLMLGSQDGVAMAAVGLRALDDGVCEMKRLYVRPAARGTGLGRRLVVALIAAARERGYRTMRLDTITGHHDDAIRLYRQFGFRTIPAYYDSPIPETLYMELGL